MDIWRICSIFNDISSNHIKLSIFDLGLLSKYGSNLISTATIDIVLFDHNGTAILCAW